VWGTWINGVFNSFNNLCHLLDHLYWVVPVAVSPESITASEPSITELAIVYFSSCWVKLLIMVSIIWVATITGMPFFALRISSFELKVHVQFNQGHELPLTHHNNDFIYIF
jgi:hypothetical protein